MVAIKRGLRVIQFIETYCRVPEGRHVGKPIRLAPFQKRFIRRVYDNPKITRRAILTMARKNGKTALIAAILLAHICGPEAIPNSQIASGALSKDQAALVFDLACKMINLNGELMEVSRIVPSQKRIIGIAVNVQFRALSADAHTAHGLSPVLVIIDEAGQIKGPTSEFIDALETSQGAYEFPLIITISTQAASDNDLLSRWIDDAIRTNDPHTVCEIYAADPELPITSRKAMRQANPAMGKFLQTAVIEDQLKRAERMPAEEAKARNLHLNQRVAQESLWLSPAVWRQGNELIDLTLFRRERVALGLDLSAKHDLTAAVLAARDPADLSVHLLPFCFTPSSGVEERAARDRAPYDAWVRDGHLFTAGHRSMDYEDVFRRLGNELIKMGIEIDTIEFDPWRIDDAKRAADAVGVFDDAKWVKVIQGFRSMGPRIDAFATNALEGRIRHGGHPLLNMAAANAIAVQDAAGNVKLDKSKSTQRIDPMIAAVMAVYAVTDGADTEGEFDVEQWIA